MKKRKSDFYPKEVLCPICGHEFSVLKVKSTALQMEKRDADFCVHYRTINPLYYSIWVCDQCNYAGDEQDFDSKPRVHDDEMLQQQVYDMFKKYGQLHLCGERELEDALVSYAVALEWAVFLHRSNFRTGNLHLRTAWLHRGKDEALEKLSLERAVECYRTGFEKEADMPRGLGELGVAYLIGELYRRLGRLQEAAQWFGRVLQTREVQSREAQSIVAMCRDQWQDMKAEMKDDAPLSAGEG